MLVIGALASSGLMYVTRNAWTLGQHVLLAVAVAELVKFGGQIDPPGHVVTWATARFGIVSASSASITTR